MSSYLCLKECIGSFSINDHISQFSVVYSLCLLVLHFLHPSINVLFVPTSSSTSLYSHPLHSITYRHLHLTIPLILTHPLHPHHCHSSQSTLIASSHHHPSISTYIFPFSSPFNIIITHYITTHRSSPFLSFSTPHNTIITCYQQYITHYITTTYCRTLTTSPTSFTTVLLQHGVGHLVGGADFHLVPLGGQEVVLRGTPSVRLLFPRHGLGSACRRHHPCFDAETGRREGVGVFCLSVCLSFSVCLVSCDFVSFPLFSVPLSLSLSIQQD